MRARASALAGLLLSLFPAVALIAATHVWSGLGASPNWNDGFNWSSDPNAPGTPPFNDPNGVFLEFPATGVPQQFMFQDIPGLTVNNMTFNGGILPYILGGTPLAVDGAITVGNDPNGPPPPPGLFHTIDLPLFLLSPLTGNVIPGASLRLQGPIFGPGGVTLIGGGTTHLAGNNNYDGPTLVNAGTLVVTSPNALGSSIGDTSVASGATLSLLNYNQVFNPDPETIFAEGGSRLSVLGTNTLFSLVLVPGPGGPVFLELSPGSVLNVDSLGGNGGPVVADFGGTLRITGPSPVTGLLAVANARLIVNGVLVTPQVQLFQPQAVLGGTGAVGSVQVFGGTISPGESAGILTVAGNLTYLTGQPSSFQVELDGLAPGTGYDQLNVGGPVSIGATTSLVATRSFLPPIGSTFTILNAPGGLTGEFVGLPDLAQFPIGGQTYQIDYTPTSVVLTAMDLLPVTLQDFTLE